MTTTADLIAEARRALDEDAKASQFHCLDCRNATMANRARNNLARLVDALEESERRREAAEASMHWEDVDDEWAAAIKAAHPTRSGSHDEYETAMKMVGHRHSKGELVSLVNWLLVRLRGAGK